MYWSLKVISIPDEESGANGTVKAANQAQSKRIYTIVCVYILFFVYVMCCLLHSVLWFAFHGMAFIHLGVH